MIEAWHSHVQDMYRGYSRSGEGEGVRYVLVICMMGRETGRDEV